MTISRVLTALTLTALAASSFAQRIGAPAKSDSASTSSAATAAPSGNMAPLPIKLPTALFVGTPQKAKVENLEAPTGKLRPPFMAPKGAVNLALDKSVTSSVKELIIGKLAQVVDGDKEGPDGSYIEMDPGKQWIQIDLGQESELYAIVVWHFHMQAVATLDTIVQVSNDPEFAKGTTTLFNNDTDNSSGLGAGKDKNYIETFEGRLIEAKNAHARYIRLYSSGNSTNKLNHYVEVEAYGKPLGAAK